MRYVEELNASYEGQFIAEEELSRVIYKIVYVGSAGVLLRSVETNLMTFLPNEVFYTLTWIFVFRFTDLRQ